MPNPRPTASGLVLAGRSGMQSKEMILAEWATHAGFYSVQPGREWRSVEDTTLDPVIGAQYSWPFADQWSLNLLKNFKAQHPDVPTKSGIMLGLGEDFEQIKATMRDLRAHNVDMITIGQYLQPTAHHHPVLKYWTPEDYKALEVYGYELGFSHVASGPMVRSSYHADRMAAEAGFVDGTA